MNHASVAELIGGSAPVVRRVLTWGWLLLPVLASAACVMTGGAPGRY